MGLDHRQVRRRSQRPLPPPPTPSDRPQRPEPPRRQQSRPLRRPMARNADWIAWEFVTVVVLRKEEGDGGGDRPDSRGDLDLRGDRAVGDGGVDAAAALHSDFRGRRLGSCFELLELLWVARRGDVEGLGGFYYHRRTLCSSSGDVVDVCSLYPK